MLTHDAPSIGGDAPFDDHPAPGATCPECAGGLISTDRETRCEECGLVVADDRLDRGPEWRTFEADETDPSRVGAPLTAARHDRGLSTEIGFDAVASGRKRRRLARLRREHNRGRFTSKAERTLADALGQIARLTSALALPRSVREEASAIYRQAQAADLITGRSIETLAAASVYAAVRAGDVTRPMAELLAVARVDRSALELGYRVLNRELELAIPPAEAADRVPTLASAVDAPDAVRRRALELAAAAVEAGLTSGRDPWGVAAGAVYLADQAYGGGLTQGELAAAADVSRKTLRARYEELEAELG